MSSRRKGSSRRGDYPTRWSEWEWNEQHQRDVRYRELSRGEWEWEYAEPRLNEPQDAYTQGVEPTPWTPRDRSADPQTLPSIEDQNPHYDEQPDNYLIDNGLSDITQGLAQTNIDSYTRDFDQHYPQQPQYPQQQQQQQQYLQVSHGRDEKRKGKSSSDRNDSPYPSRGGTSDDRYTARYGSYPPEPIQDQGFQNTASQTETAQSFVQPSETETPQASFPTPQSAYSQDYSGFGELDSGQTGGYIRTRNWKTTHEKLDPRFRVHRSTEFKFGKVFKVLWSEPTGSGGTEITDPRYGEKSFLKIRRFLIVKTGVGHSVCLPIQTYGLQGVLKHGVHSEDHAVVYSSRRDGPFLLDREEGLMMKRPIRIEIRDPNHKLDPLSRLNYAETYTVEHNVKVLFIGKVAENFEQEVVTSFNKTHPPVASYSGESGSPGVFSRNAKYNTDHPYRNATPVPGAQPYGLSYSANPQMPQSESQEPRSQQDSHNPDYPYPNAIPVPGAQSYGLSYSANPQMPQSEYQEPRYQQDSHQPVYTISWEEPSTSEDYNQYTAPTYDDGYEEDSPREKRSKEERRPKKNRSNRLPVIAIREKSGSPPYRSATVEALPDTPIPPPLNIAEDIPVVLTSPSVNTAEAQRPDSTSPSLDTVEALPETPIQSSSNIVEASPPICTPPSLDTLGASQSAPTPPSPNTVEDIPVVAILSSVNIAKAPPPGSSPPSLDTTEASPNTTTPSSDFVEAPPLIPIPSSWHTVEVLHADRSTINFSEVPPNDPLPYLSENPTSIEMSPDQLNLSDQNPTSGQFTQLDLKNAVLESTPMLSRRSSVVSIESLVFSSTFSQSSRATSVDGADDVDSGAQRLCDFLSTQDWLLKLSKEASEKVSIDKFENNLRRSLKQFAVDLKKEGATTIMVETGSAIGRIARNAANLFRQSLERLTKSDQEADRIDTKGDQVNWPSGDYREEDPDEDDMDDVLDYKEGEGEEDPKSLEILLAKSVALQLLEENLRLFISPDPIRRMFFEMWPVTRSRTSQFTVEYDVQWEVPSFFGTYFAEGEELGNVLTVTGEAINAQAQSCRDYLVQTWPKIGATLLDCLQELLVHGSDGASGASEIVSFNMKLGSKPDTQARISSASVVVLASHDVQIEVASAIAWICAAVRYSPSDDISYSSTAVSAIKSPSPTQKIAIRMAKLEGIQKSHPCWHPLLPRSVIAKGFPIRYRTNGKGLEISFADMAMLSHSVSFTEHDGGLIVEGLRTVLIPMEIISQDEPDEAIQWHLEYKRQLKDPELRSLSEIFATVPGSKWYKSHDPNELFRKRCFLGWAEEVAVMIGTEQFSASEVFPSKAKQTSKTCRVDKSHAISIGLTGVGINLNAGKAWQKTARPSTIAWDRCKGIRDTLSDEHRYSLLIYDTNQQIGWLLPRLSVILYMAHKIFTSREQTGHRLLSGGKETYFRHAKPNADGASAAFSALDELMSFEVRKSRVSDTREGFSVMLEEIIFVMDKVRNALESANTEPGRIRSDLYGVELNDLLELESPVDIKSVPVQQPWTEMVRSRICGLVLFCRGFGQPIVPTSPLMMCSSYQTVPPVRDLLATTGKVLHTFIKKYSVPEGAKLGHTIEWNCKEGRLVQSHTDQQKSPIYHEQDLHHIEKSSPNLELLDSVGRFILSGFIFTDKPQRPCSEVIPPMQSGFLDAVQHPFGEGIKPLPQMPEDDSSSENSNESETRFDIGNLPTSSISSDESPPIEEQDQSIIGRLSRGTAARTGDIVESRQDPAYVIDSVPSKQLAIASYSLSSTPRGLKKKDGCVNLGDFRDKGKGQASVKKTCDERGRERPPASDVARTVTTAPNRQAQRSGKGRERSQHSVRE